MAKVAIRTIAKLMVCSVAACAQTIENCALSLLGHLPKPMQSMDIQLRAAAGLAAIPAWSGPLRAFEIVGTVETEDVVLSSNDPNSQRARQTYPRISAFRHHRRRCRHVITSTRKTCLAKA